MLCQHVLLEALSVLAGFKFI